VLPFVLFFSCALDVPAVAERSYFKQHDFALQLLFLLLIQHCKRLLPIGHSILKYELTSPTCIACQLRAATAWPDVVSTATLGAADSHASAAASANLTGDTAFAASAAAAAASRVRAESTRAAGGSVGIGVSSAEHREPRGYSTTRIAAAAATADDGVQTNDGELESDLSASTLADLLASMIERGGQTSDNEATAPPGPLELAGRALAASVVRSAVPAARASVDVLARRYTEAPERVVADLMAMRTGSVTGAMASVVASSLLGAAGGANDNDGGT